MLVTEKQPYQNRVEIYPTDKFPNAKQLRDNRARELRKQGYEVITQKINFIDLARCYVYRLEY